MVGDTIGDRIAAGLCDIDFYGVNYGFGFSNKEAECVSYAKRPIDIVGECDIYEK